MPKTKTAESKWQSAATLTIVDACDMTTRQRKRIAKWLEKEAAALVEHGHNYATKMRARYLYSS